MPTIKISCQPNPAVKLWTCFIVADDSVVACCSAATRLAAVERAVEYVRQWHPELARLIADLPSD